jgi:hypothetical protein
MNQTMGRLLKMKEEEYSGFVRVMFGLTSPSPVQDEKGEMEWVDQSLNESQKDAIKFALASREVALIHGPPGVSTQFPWCLGDVVCWFRVNCPPTGTECRIYVINGSSMARACWEADEFELFREGFLLLLGIGQLE